jgi:hypothetical protein
MSIKEVRIRESVDERLQTLVGKGMTLDNFFSKVLSQCNDDDNDAVGS